MITELIFTSKYLIVLLLGGRGVCRQLVNLGLRQVISHNIV